MTKAQFENVLHCHGRIEYKEQLKDSCVHLGIPVEPQSSTKSILAKLRQATPARSWRRDPNSGCDRRADPANMGGASSSIRGRVLPAYVYVRSHVRTCVVP